MFDLEAWMCRFVGIIFPQHWGHPDGLGMQYKQNGRLPIRVRLEPRLVSMLVDASPPERDAIGNRASERIYLDFLAPGIQSTPAQKFNYVLTAESLYLKPRP